MIIDDPWHELKAFTAARIALGRTGSAMPLQEVLRFKLAHAHARDAVYSSLDIDALGEVNLLHSKAADRAEYLQRPDKGRQLNENSRLSLTPVNADLAIILVDGLSATAINHHAIPVLDYLYPMLQAKKISLAPVQLVEQGRVAIGDEIGELLKVKLILVLIGERPGLTSPDSLGAYLTWQPRSGLTDEARNCISNIRPEGLPYKLAAEKMYYLIHEALRLQLTGVMLKDNYNLRIS
ncbi:ethanolamine ammonia-lyase subunit EutC [Chitinophaga sp. SYP-B3965]|uniref:ethanolamine ammonia-lyase subunit EutC n=1 Tax=Chitinophaga sp. SYP-B3965 TaxID=2663120 RepID=UPI0012995E9A|nr:ethanolamine ammonia-lyase subunit EutC [Chitinophaga sp. SYP-B3965]MRG47162.1 ethanolamine ammonia-lyase subunit EutC [Chitinophaga sp. SYP-B3965]